MTVVRADEKEYKEWIGNIKEKSEFAESEAKLNTLREKVGLDAIGPVSDKMRSKGISNPEYETEKKSEQEKYEKRTGILTGLGQSVTEQKSKLWYMEDPIKHKKQHAKKRAFEEREDPLYKLVNSKEPKASKSNKVKKTDKVSIEELRQQRLKREAIERQRQEALLAKHKK